MAKELSSLCHLLMEPQSPKVLVSDPHSKMKTSWQFPSAAHHLAGTGSVHCTSCKSRVVSFQLDDGVVKSIGMSGVEQPRV